MYLNSDQRSFAVGVDALRGRAAAAGPRWPSRLINEDAAAV